MDLHYIHRYLYTLYPPLADKNNSYSLPTKLKKNNTYTVWWGEGSGYEFWFRPQYNNIHIIIFYMTAPGNYGRGVGRRWVGNIIVYYL